MRYFSSAFLSCIVVAVLNSSNAWADHEPHWYSYNGARSRTNIIEFAPSAEPRILTFKSIGSDPLVNRKMDDILEGTFLRHCETSLVWGSMLLNCTMVKLVTAALKNTWVKRSLHTQKQSIHTIKVL